MRPRRPSTEKHCTPAVVPPFRTQARYISRGLHQLKEGGSRTSINTRRVCHTLGEHAASARRLADKLRVGDVLRVDPEHRDSIAPRVNGEQVLRFLVRVGSRSAIKERLTFPETTTEPDENNESTRASAWPRISSAPSRLVRTYL